MTPQSPAAPWTARAVRLSRKYATIAALAGAPLILIATPQARSHDLPLHAVIDGHHVQPREDQLRALGQPDVTPAQAAEIERLYAELMRSEEPLRGPHNQAGTPWYPDCRLCAAQIGPNSRFYHSRRGHAAALPPQ